MDITYRRDLYYLLLLRHKQLYIRIYRPDTRKAKLLCQNLGHIGRQKTRKGRTEVYVLHPQVEQRQKNDTAFCSYQAILKARGSLLISSRPNASFSFFIFPANTFNGAALVSCSFLTLIAKHAHLFSSPILT